MKSAGILLLKIVVFSVLGFAVLVLVTSKTSVFGGLRSFVVLTGSMEPTLPTGSVVFTRSHAYYQNGDIITFRSGNITITHRVEAVTADAGGIIYRTKGDANGRPDSQPVAQADVLGKTVFFVPFVGRVVTLMRTVPGYVGLIVVPAVVFVGFELWNIKKEMEKEIEKKLAKKMNIQTGH